ncbi:histidine phosphatase family protein [Peptostreptococcus faecalis]|uniref:histidine phosphatase family protein n=1 Tax=Peptostreptococcus faecalis TaxID=2045015 RepID=UPI000C7D5622|nr:histidine phosphatase family protein [Peptostreptococcus faecalis]
MKKLYLIRHGHTVDNEKMLYSGFNDCELSEVGKKQAKQLNEFLKDIKVEKIYTSTLKRTVHTINDFAEYKNKDIHRIEGLREMNFGLFDGRSFRDIRNEYPEEAKKLLKHDATYKFPKGESLTEMYERNIKSLDNVMKENQESENIMICSHMGTIRNILSYLIIGSHKLHWNFKVLNATITVVEFTEKIPVLETLGYVPYDKSLLMAPYNIK